MLAELEPWPHAGRWHAHRGGAASAHQAQAGVVRTKQTDPWVRRHAVKQISNRMLHEATRAIAVRAPLMPTTAAWLDARGVAVSVLHTGLGMAEGSLHLVCLAKVGFLGIYGERPTLEPVEDYRKVPRLKGSHAFVCDPTMATGVWAQAAPCTCACCSREKGSTPYTPPSRRWRVAAPLSAEDSRSEAPSCWGEVAGPSTCFGAHGSGRQGMIPRPE